jgi:SAM-dependent methyltransferase
MVSTLRSCPDCDLVFFSHRYSDDELDAIYGDYREDQYFSVRRRWEPWYRQAVNVAFDEGSPAVLERLEFMEQVIAKSGWESFDVVVDFGGDGGQFFPSSCRGRKILIDMSSKSLEPGIERLKDFADLDANPDLVLICHVLEHLNDPLAVLVQARRALQSDGFLYVEVPLDLPRTHHWHAKQAYRRYLHWISGKRPLTVLADFASGVSRQLGFRIPRLGLVKESEHINYFTQRSLTTLLERAGYTVITASAEPRAQVGGLRLGRLGMLAKPTSVR